MSKVIYLVPKLWLGNAYLQALLGVLNKTTDSKATYILQAELVVRHSQARAWEREKAKKIAARGAIAP